MEERTIPLFDLVATVVVVAIAAYALLQVWNIDATAWIASAGVVGIAVGFAAGCEVPAKHGAIEDKREGPPREERPV